MTIWFDVEDMVQYFRNGNRRISGIQRVSFEIFRAAKTLEAEGGPAIGFVRHGARAPSLIPVAWADLLADFGGDGPASAPRAPTVAEALAVAEAPAVPVVIRERPRGAARTLARRVADRLPPNVRGPLVLAAVMQVQVVAALARFTAASAAYPARRGAAASVRAARRLAKRPPPPPPKLAHAGSFARLSQPGDVLLVLGAPWNRERYGDMAR